eukprot:11064696-Prorocentrum_lima.AAC.1
MESQTSSNRSTFCANRDFLFFAALRLPTICSTANARTQVQINAHTTMGDSSGPSSTGTLRRSHVKIVR